MNCIVSLNRFELLLIREEDNICFRFIENLQCARECARAGDAPGLGLLALCGRGMSIIEMCILLYCHVFRNILSGLCSVTSEMGVGNSSFPSIPLPSFSSELHISEILQSWWGSPLDELDGDRVDVKHREKHPYLWIVNKQHSGCCTSQVHWAIREDIIGDPFKWKSGSLGLYQLSFCMAACYW